ncbi:type II secretion system protein [Pseudidiomarina aquimaris]|uniref:type II secretion system protein n=1 Tax=Pseudidiomarina aquimaris TaxID=641841 RepID=UPI003A96A594
MKRQQGFTLIELIIVIVVLGILAVTAAPQFINFSSDARASTVKGAQASIQGAMQLVYARSLVNGTEGTSPSSVTTEGGAVTTSYGYPTADAAGIAVAAGLNANDWTQVDGTGAAAAEATPAGGAVGFHPAGVTPDFTVTAETGDSCHVLYTAAVDEDNAATVSAVTGGC